MANWTFIDIFLASSCALIFFFNFNNVFYFCPLGGLRLNLLHSAKGFKSEIADGQTDCSYSLSFALDVEWSCDLTPRCHALMPWYRAIISVLYNGISSYALPWCCMKLWHLWNHTITMVGHIITTLRHNITLLHCTVTSSCHTLMGQSHNYVTP